MWFIITVENKKKRLPICLGTLLHYFIVEYTVIFLHLPVFRRISHPFKSGILHKAYQIIHVVERSLNAVSVEKSLNSDGRSRKRWIDKLPASQSRIRD